MVRLDVIIPLRTLVTAITRQTDRQKLIIFRFGASRSKTCVLANKKMLTFIGKCLQLDLKPNRYSKHLLHRQNNCRTRQHGPIECEEHIFTSSQVDTR